MDKVLYSKLKQVKRGEPKHLEVKQQDEGRLVGSSLLR